MSPCSSVPPKRSCSVRRSKRERLGIVSAVHDAGAQHQSIRLVGIARRAPLAQFVGRQVRGRQHRKRRRTRRRPPPRVRRPGSAHQASRWRGPPAAGAGTRAPRLPPPRASAARGSRATRRARRLGCRRRSRRGFVGQALAHLVGDQDARRRVSARHGSRRCRRRYRCRAGGDLGGGSTRATGAGDGFGTGAATGSTVSSTMDSMTRSSGTSSRSSSTRIGCSSVLSRSMSGAATSLGGGSAAGGLKASALGSRRRTGDRGPRHRREIPSRALRLCRLASDSASDGGGCGLGLDFLGHRKSGPPQLDRSRQLDVLRRPGAPRRSSSRPARAVRPRPQD